MFARIARTFDTSAIDQPAAAGAAASVAWWRWRYRDPATGERVGCSELLTTAEVSAIDPAAELIPGSRVTSAPAHRPAGAAR